MVGLLASDPDDPYRRTLTNPWPASEVRVIRAGDSFGFMFPIACPADDYETRRIVRFTDDTGLTWQIDEDLHLKKMRPPAGPGLMSPPPPP
jgi:hypothetical protein